MPFSAAELRTLFEPGGTLSHELHPFEPRPQQVAMAEEVAYVLERGGRLVVEAPTGVGKSLAYLVPALAWARAAGRPVVVATYTRALQDQLLRHDAPLALRALASRGTIAVLKGRANYVCRRRLGRALATAAPGTEASLRLLLDWADRTDTGDFADCDALSPEELAHLAPRVASDAQACAGNLCSPAEGCFFKRARALAQQADVVIVNHALLTIELLGEKGLLPDHGALVVDEAHHLEDAATRQMTLSLGARRFRAAGEAAQAASGDGVGAQLRKLFDTFDAAGAAPLRALLADWQKACGIAASRGEQWFGRLNSGDEKSGGDSRRRYRDAAELKALCPLDPTELAAAVNGAVGRGAGLQIALGDAVNLAPDPDAARGVAAELDGALREWKSLQETLDIALHPEGPAGGWIQWKEWGDRESFTLVAAPRDVSGPLGKSLVERHDRVVLTSATLTVGGGFDHILARTGLPIDTATLALDSPFDFEAAVRVLATADGPDPRDVGYGDHLARALEELVLATRRKTLALFTSYALLRDVVPRLRAPLEGAGIELLAQGQGGAVATLLRRFRKPGPALLCGTASFWEGIDLPGEALEVLVVTRLPFPVPSDPLVEARGEALRERGADPFMNDAVPEAVLRLKQGFGRLIRRQGDRGVVVVLDNRFLTARYGGLFRSALPVAPVACPTVSDLADRARDWMGPVEVTP